MVVLTEQRGDVVVHLMLEGVENDLIPVPSLLDFGILSRCDDAITIFIKDQSE